MGATSISLGISNIFIGSIFILISIPLVRRKIPMNSLYGIRFEKSFDSEENWYKINAYGGKQLIIWSVPLLILGVATFFISLNGKPGMVTLIACAPLIVVVPAIKSYNFAKKLQKSDNPAANATWRLLKTTTTKISKETRTYSTG